MRRVAKNLAPALAIALAIVAPRPARACSPVPPRWPRLAEPVFEDPRIDIESERLDLDCAALGRDATCTLEIVLRIRNRGASPVETAGAILTGSAVPAVIAPSISPSPLVLTPAAPKRFLPTVPTYRDLWLFIHRAFAFDVRLGAGEARDLVVRTTFGMQRFVDPCFSEGVEARHAIFAAGRRRGSFELLYFHSNAGRRLRRDWIELHVHHPPAWDSAIGSLPSYEGDGKDPPSVPVRHGPGEEHAEAAVDHAEAVYVEFTLARSPVWGGGPILGAGYGFGPAADRGLRLRLGYEFAAPVWLLHAVAAETNARRMFAIVPSSELVTRSQRMAPLVLGAGAGLPIRIKPAARAGARFEASASYGLFTLRGALDVYPKTDTQPTFVEGLVGGQLSL